MANAISAHSKFDITVIFTSNVVFYILVVFVSLAWIGHNGIFVQSTFDVFDKFSVEITPDIWLKWIGIINIVFGGAWLLYGISTIFRKDENGTHIYELKLTPPSVYIWFSITNLIEIAWLFTWVHEEFIASLVLSVIITVKLVVIVVMSFVSLHKNKYKIRNEKKMKFEVFLVQALAQNGFAGNASWTGLFTLFNLSLVMTYRGFVFVTWSCTIVLIILSVLIFIWFFLDVFLFYHYTRTILLPYLFLLVFLTGVFSENFDLEKKKQNSIFLLILLILVTILVVFRTIIAFRITEERPLSKNLTFTTAVKVVKSGNEIK